MRNSGKFLILFLSSFLLALLSGCASPVPVTPIWPEYKPIDGVVTPDLRAFLRSTASPKIVLRVPNTVGGITQTEKTSVPQYENLYSLIERHLVEAGFIVRDRALLQTLLVSGLSDYSAIGSKIDTELILEITNLSFGDDSNSLTTRQFSTPKGIKQTVNTLSSPVATLDVRVVQVATGSIGSIMTLKIAACEVFICEMTMHNNWVFFPGEEQILLDKKYQWARTERYNTAVNIMSKRLLDRLRGDL